MSAGLKGDIRKLRDLERAIKYELPLVIGEKVATACAHVISTMARATFEASEDAFGEPWQLSDTGDVVDLNESGALASGVRYTAIGTKLRAQLGPKYAKYQVGLRAVFPRSALPMDYVKAIDKISREIITAELKGYA